MGAPRFVMDDFWPSDLFLGGVPGAWYDPTDVNVNWRRNLLTYTEQFENAAWAAFAGAAPTATNILAPDGTNTAERFDYSATPANRYRYQDVTVANAGLFTFSVWLKAPAPCVVGLRFAGYVGASNTTTTVNVTSTWQRVSLTTTIVAGGLVGSVGIDQRSGVIPGVTDNATIDIWGAQLEVGSTATTYQQIVTPEITYAATQTTNLFQDNTGLTPVWAVEQPVGLILDKSQGLALGADLITNGGPFVTTTGWTAVGGATLSVDAGRLKVAQGLTDYVTASQAITTVVGRTYRVTYDLVSDGTSSSSFLVYARQFPGSTNIALSTTGFGTGKTLYFTAVGTTTYIEPGSGTSADNIYGLFNNIKVELVAGNHASQSTAASRPTYRARYNLLTYSEQFDNAAWTKFNSTISTDAAVAPDGTTTADKFIGTVAVASHWVGSSATVVNGLSYTVSVYAKAAEYSQVLVYDVNINTYVTVDLSTGTVTSATATSYSVTSAGSGWYRIAVTANSSSTTGYLRPYLWNGVTSVFAGDGVSGILLWGAQLLTAADVTATGNAYQRIAAATVYDTAPIFRPYLAFDGVDDSLATAAINFTSTDKMTVFAGVTKSSDAALGVVTELSATIAANNGSFLLSAPNSAAANYNWSAGGTTRVNNTVTTYTAPTTNVLTGLADIAAPANTIRVNGAAVATVATTQGTGTFGNFAMFLGRRNNTSNPFNGRIYELIVRGAASSTTEIIDTETWVNARTGAY